MMKSKAFAAVAVVLTGFGSATPVLADDLGTLMTACRERDGGLPEPVCQCIASRMTKQDLAAYAQLAKAREGTDSQVAAYERQNAAFVTKFDGIVKRCQRGG
ncbi:MAG TPA: hypothetical protein VD995_11420 [Azospirillum sp.]|nr:hypothetical protein [Azospirillum sp.]